MAGLQYLPKFTKKNNDSYIQMVWNLIPIDYIEQHPKLQSISELKALQDQTDLQNPLNMEYNPNFELVIDFKLFNQILVSLSKELIFDLNEHENMRPYLNIKTLSLLFPDITDIEKDGDKEVGVKIEVILDKEKIIKIRDFNQFVFAKFKIHLYEPKTKEPICNLLIDNFIQFRHSSSFQKPFNYYVNQPIIRVKSVKASECKFKVDEQMYKKIFEDIMKVNLFEFFKISLAEYKEILVGPSFHLLNEQAFEFAFEFKVDI